MKKIFFTSLFLYLCSAHLAFSQIGSVCKWDNDKKAAVVLTFDDWTAGQLPIVVPELKKRNMRATFYVMRSIVGTAQHPWSEVQQAAADGNEIANHTITHPSLSNISAAQLSTEIRGMRDSILKHLPSQSSASFAYPYGAFNQQVIDSVKKTGHISSRSVFPSSKNYTYDFAPKEDDYYQILTYGMDGTKTTAQFFQEVKNVIDGGGLLTYLYHSVDDAKGTYKDTWYAKVQQDSLQKQFDALLSVQDRVWITTMEEAIKYHREARCAKITEVKPFDGKQWVVNLSDTLANNKVYHQALSIKLDTKGIKYTEILQNKQAVKIDAIEADMIMFHAVPDGGPIILKGHKEKGKKQK